MLENIKIVLIKGGTMHLLSGLESRKSKVESQSGFTLLELLVVIAIIGILAAVVITNLSGAKAKGYDAKIQSDISSLSQAISVGTVTATDFSAFDTAGSDNIGKLATTVTDLGLMKKMPVHPFPPLVYHYAAVDLAPADGAMEYILYGQLSTGKCFIVANGSSFTGNCASPDTDVTQ